MTEVVVIGAGPAGLEATSAALAQGASVTLIDATDQAGGQYWRHPPQQGVTQQTSLQHDWADYQQLENVLQSPRCSWTPGASVWAISRHPTLTVHAVVGDPDGTGREPVTLRPDAVVLATGAHDRTLPFPGWDLPGVFTGGAAQALAKGDRVAIGSRVMVAGSGPFLLPVASSLLSTGASVAGVLEVSRWGALATGWMSRPWQLARSAGKVGELAGYARDLVRHRVPYRTGTTVIAAHGHSRVEEVTVAHLDTAWRVIPGTERTLRVDAVAMTHGFTPRLELAVAAGCARVDGFVAVDDDQRTSVEGVFAAGEITGIGGADLARAEGALAGAAAAGARASDPAQLRRRKRVGSGRAFAVRLVAAHPIGSGWTGWLDDDTIVCRCEEVTAGELRRSAAATESSLRSLKLNTRAGLGICQARMCGAAVADLVTGPSQRSDSDPAEFDRRPIAVPLRLGELASIPAGQGEPE